MKLMQEISQQLQDGSRKRVKALVMQAVEEGYDAKDILEDGLIAGMMEVGKQFKANEIFIPEVLVSARAMNEGLSVLEPNLAKSGNEPIGKIVIGTVKGDLHDIGKNLVTMFFKGNGFEVYDLGIDVEPGVFIEKAEEVGADIIAMSALLSTTMPAMKETIELLEKRNLREKYTVMVGGAPLDEDFAKEIGADYYTADGATAAEIARKVVLNDAC